jgi:hypothetical protein
MPKTGTPPNQLLHRVEGFGYEWWWLNEDVAVHMDFTSLPCLQDEIVIILV